MKFTGPIPPMVTPFDDKGALDIDAHLHNVQQWSSAGLKGFLVMGSNSEAAYLEESEKLDLIRHTVAQVGGKAKVLVGTGMESTRGTLELTNKAAALGADAALLLTPFYYREAMSEQALIRHFFAIADHSDIPVLLYNVPKYTGINVSSALVREISQHPNIIGMKDSSGNIGQLVQFQAAAADDFQVLVGTAAVWYPALDLGATAGIMALANCAPAECLEVERLFAAGEKEAAKALYRTLVPVNALVTGNLGVAALKYACDLRGFRGGKVRSPLSELTDTQKKLVEKTLTDAGLI